MALQLPLIWVNWCQVVNLLLSLVVLLTGKYLISVYIHTVQVTIYYTYI